jgi:hypothetical protein
MSDQHEIYDKPEYLAKQTHLDIKTLANWRTQRKGPPYTKLGGTIRYPRSQWTAWFDKKLVVPYSEQEVCDEHKS